MPLNTHLIDRVNFAVQFEKYRNLLAKRWWILAVCLALSVLIGGVRAYLQHDQYLAIGSMMVSPRVNVALTDVYNEELFSFYSTQAQLMESRQVKEAVYSKMLSFEKTLPIPANPHLNVSRKRDTSIFALSVTSASAEYSERYLELIMKEFIAFKKRLRTQTSESTMSSLLRETERLGQELRKAEAELFEFQKNNNIAYLEGEKSAADKNAIFLLRAEREALAKHLRPKHPKLARINEEIERKEQLLKFALDEAKGENANAVSRDQREKQTEGERQAIESNQKVADYALLKANVARTKELYELLVKRNYEIDVSKGIDQEAVAINEPAMAFSTPVGPHRTQQLLIAIAIGLGVGAVIILLLEKFDDRIKDLDQLQEVVSETVLGQVPIVEIETDSKTELRMSDLPTHNTFSESLRNIRSSLMFSPVASVAKTIAVTSALPSEGKTTCAVNLAICLSRVEGARTLLIDADLRRMSVHKYFDIENGIGLSEVLSGQAAFSDCVVASGLPNLDILSAGTTPPNPGELILSGNFKKMIETAAGIYHRVIFDTAPILATDDILSLAPLVNGVIVIAKANRTSISMFRKSLDLLKERGAKVFGVLLNGVDTTSAHYYYYYYYSSYYQSHDRGRRGSSGRNGSDGSGVKTPILKRTY